MDATINALEEYFIFGLTPKIGFFVEQYLRKTLK
jgi:hypothetical protein